MLDGSVGSVSSVDYSVGSIDLWQREFLGFPQSLCVAMLLFLFLSSSPACECVNVCVCVCVCVWVCVLFSSL